MKTITTLLASIACCLSAAPAFAEKGSQALTVTGKQADPDTIRVPYGDLSLAKTTDADLLRTRVKQATRRACSALYDNSFLSQKWACLDTAQDIAEPQIVAAIKRAGAGQNLAEGTVVLRFAGR